MQGACATKKDYINASGDQLSHYRRHSLRVAFNRVPDKSYRFTLDPPELAQAVDEGSCWQVDWFRTHNFV
jgi:hypothetical protein